MIGAAVRSFLASCNSPCYLSAVPLQAPLPPLTRSPSPVSSGQRHPITLRLRLCSWDVFPYDLFPNQLRPADLLLGQVSNGEAGYGILASPARAGERSTSSARLHPSDLTCGTFSHTTCYPISCALWACFSDRSVSGERSEPIGALGVQSHFIAKKDSAQEIPCRADRNLPIKF